MRYSSFWKREKTNVRTQLQFELNIGPESCWPAGAFDQIREACGAAEHVIFKASHSPLERRTIVTAYDPDLDRTGYAKIDDEDLVAVESVRHRAKLYLEACCEAAWHLIHTAETEEMED